MANSQNIVGPQVRKLRYERGMTQDALSARLQVLGLEMSRASLSKIEAGLRCVTDRELRVIADALKVGVDDLYPAKPNPKKRS
jgi:transcriptional regulator with XRE-family HTH domain